MVPRNMQESRMHPVAQPGAVPGATRCQDGHGLLWEVIGEPWGQGSQHGVACGVQVGEQERGQPRTRVSGRERVLGVMNSRQCHSTKPVYKVWGRDKKTFWGSDSAPKSDPVPSSILS